MQTSPDEFFNLTYEPQSSDCLSLNVFLPNNSAAAPVMVYIHGSGFSFGGSALYPAEALANSGAVVVTLNYRLGIFGSLAMPDSTSYNFGLSDQALAIEWVRANVAAFGGDVDRITLFGESAGGLSVLIHANADSPGFSRAIVQSAGPWLAFPPSLASGIGSRIASAFNCSTLDCMRQIPAKSLARISYPSIPVADGKLLALCSGQGPCSPYPSFNLSSVELMIGTNGNEGAIYPYAFNKFSLTMDNATFTTLMTQYFQQATSLVVSWYPPTTPFVEFANIFGAYQAYCGADTVAKKSNALYRYVFNATASKWFFPAQLGATHTAELPFLFNMSFALRATLSTPSEKSLAVKLQNAWIGFASFGCPGFAKI